jgi:preprotein translocase SecE subunit
MADVVAPPTAPESGLIATIRGIPAFYRAVVVEMKKVTWPEVADVRRATVAIIIFVLALGLVIYLLDVALQGLFANLIPRLFVGR